MRSDLALAALASAAVPGMKPVTVAGIGLPDDGRDHDLQTAVVEDATGRRWLVRAPLTPVAGARLQRNDELVRQLARHVPFKVPAAVGYASLGRDGSAAVYPYVEGSPLDLHRLPGGPGLASAVGRALAAVHNIARGVFEEQDVPVYDAAGARQRIIAEVDRAAETGRVPTGLLARWEEAFDAAPMWQFATTPVHGAFTGESVLVAFTDEEDAASGRVVAVTDWDEAMIGDPAVDLAALCAQASPDAWAAVLESYTLARALRPDPYLHARARLVAELRHLRGLARAVAADDADAVRRAVEALRRADRLTEADDSLVPTTARPTGTSAPHRRPVGAVVPVEDVPDAAADDVAPPTTVASGRTRSGGEVAPDEAAPVEAAPDAAAPVEAAPDAAAPDEAAPDVADPDATMEVPRPDELEGTSEVRDGDEVREPGRAGSDGPDVQTAGADDPGHEPPATGSGDGDAPDDEDPGDVGPADEGPGDEGPGDEDPGDEDPGDSERSGGPGDEGPRRIGRPDDDAPAPSHDAPGDGADQGADDRVAPDPDEAAREDAERLHELYGMPDPARDGEGR